jgi:hypothetical protein
MWWAFRHELGLGSHLNSRYDVGRLEMLRVRPYGRGDAFVLRQRWGGISVKWDCQLGVPIPGKMEQGLDDRMTIWRCRPVARKLIKLTGTFRSPLRAPANT